MEKVPANQLKVDYGAVSFEAGRLMAHEEYQKRLDERGIYQDLSVQAHG